MRKALSTEGDWWVWVVESPQNSLAFAGEAAKLNIYVGNKSDKNPTFRRHDSPTTYKEGAVLVFATG